MDGKFNFTKLLPNASFYFILTPTLKANCPFTDVDL